jgi:Protein of unknown function (DUF2971)
MTNEPPPQSSADVMLPPELRAAAGEFAQWSRQQWIAVAEEVKITRPLYHYTNAGGLSGIIESQKLWFTSYLHLNDPSELIHGMKAVHRLLKEIGESAEGLAQNFCAGVYNIFQHENFADEFGFYIASLSHADNDLGQWRAYADNGRGFALGLAPHLFEAAEKTNPGSTEHIVMPVVYGNAADRRYRAVIEAAAGIVRAHNAYLGDEKIGILFMREMAHQLMAQLMGISLGVKHEAYSNERAVRLVIFGTSLAQKDHVKTRIRGPEIVPYMESDLPLRDKGGIVDIVVGPAASPTAKDAVQRLLQSFSIEPANLIRESDIPYRAL